ncbi:MAG: Uma2 family endonuclease [Planctomycetes bacterium]|nr:Uma2 family endonuclease [Planctomycetota bacterium]
MSMSTLAVPSKSATTVLLLTENWLRNVFPSDLYTVRGRDAGEDGDNPAVVVTHRHSKDDNVPLLVVEVSDAPMSAEAVEEAGRYAAAGARDFWVIEVAARKLHTFRNPQPDADTKHGYSYQQVRANSQFALVAPLVADIHLAQVCNLLPW